LTSEYNYDEDELLWLEKLEGPSELGIAAAQYIESNRPTGEKLSILDIGCGNGRDAFYLVNNLRCDVLGLDISKEAIDIAKERAREAQTKNVKFQCRSYTGLRAGKYDIVLCASVYHFLNREAREEFRKVVKSSLKTGAMLFLSTLSVNDSEYYGKGTPVKGEPNSFRDDVYVHFSTKEELTRDFDFVNAVELYEHDDYDPRVKGPVNYIPWILIGEYAGPRSND
jgi:SAM-dependent methyltransferase